jgi:hypothetical protein
VRRAIFWAIFSTTSSGHPARDHDGNRSLFNCLKVKLTSSKTFLKVPNLYGRGNYLCHQMDQILGIDKFLIFSSSSSSSSFCNIRPTFLLHHFTFVGGTKKFPKSDSRFFVAKKFPIFLSLSPLSSMKVLGTKKFPIFYAVLIKRSEGQTCKKILPGADVMITIFCDFRQFSTKMAFFSML